MSKDICAYFKYMLEMTYNMSNDICKSKRSLIAILPPVRN